MAEPRQIESQRLGAKRTIAYFSMEIGLVNDMPTYSGGLGVLAGDTVWSGADLHVPMVAVSLLHRKGYFTQRIDADGRQQEMPVDWPVEQFLTQCEPRITITLEGREVHVRAWRFDVKGYTDYVVPVYFLDTDLPENNEQDRGLTQALYAGDRRYRLCQEALLGMGGVRMLQALGFDAIERFHMNEGHASLLALELLDQIVPAHQVRLRPEVIEQVRQRCVFTTHTPVPAGHDQFPLDLVESVLGRRAWLKTHQDVFLVNGVLNMTYLALNLSRYVNGVAKRHGEVSRFMFPDHPIDSITNGIHCGRWAVEPFQQLFDRHIPGWRDDYFNLRHVLKVPAEDLSQAHRRAKRTLLDYVLKQTGVNMALEVFTVGFARRAATYKRADLLFSDPEQLRRIVLDSGPMQIVYAGKAHPRDEEGKGLVQRVIQAGRGLKDMIRFVYLENYDMRLGQLITGGVDVWLNTPEAPMEASGTSGMKAALNGVPSLSVLDGWWVEGSIEGVTGWGIGAPYAKTDSATRRVADAQELYQKLRKIIVLYYRHPERYLDVMRHAIALNASYFNTQRMMQQYVLRAYFR